MLRTQPSGKGPFPAIALKHLIVGTIVQFFFLSSVTTEAALDVRIKKKKIQTACIVKLCPEDARETSHSQPLPEVRNQLLLC